MPYARNSELPPTVRDKYSERCQTVFRRTFNAWDGDESSKFKVAHTAAGTCQRATKQEESLAMDSVKAAWDTAYVNNLPDSHFLYVEPGGEKDEEGKTVPRRLRHFPYKNAAGAVDLPHLRNAAARIPQSSLSQNVKDRLAAMVERLLDEHSSARKDADMTAIKFAEGSDSIIEGVGIPFGGPFAGKDIQGETFTPETDFCLDWFEKRPLLYNHGLDGKIGPSRVGDVIEHELTDDGVWVRAQLDKRTKYYGIVRKLIDAQGAGFSSGAVPYLTQRTKSGEIRRWPWFELSVTNTEANPSAAIYAVKAADALEHMEAAHISIPEPLEAALKAVDEWAIEQTPEAPELESYADETVRVLAGFKAWVDRTEDRVDFRAKSGRELSRANVESLREAYRIIGTLLERADKPREDEAEAAKSYAEHLRIEAELLGIAPG